jgi:MFS family permease
MPGQGGTDLDGAAPKGLYRWYVLALLTAAQTAYSLDRTVVSIVMEPLKREFHLSDSQLGLMAGLVFGAAFAVAAIPFGLMADRTNRRKLLAIVMTAWSLLTALCGVVRGFGPLIAARMSVGVAEAGCTPTTLSMMSDFFGRRQRATAIGIWYVGSPLGVTITFLVGGYIVQHYGWRNVFFLAGIPGLLVVALLLLTVREPRRGGLDPVIVGETAARPREVIAYVRKRTAVLHLTAGMVLCSMTTSASSAWMVSFLSREHHLTPTQSGLISAVALGVFGALGGFLAGVFADRIGRDKLGQARSHRLAWVAAGTTFFAALCGAASLHVTVAPLALGLLFAFAFFNNAYNGPANGLLLTILQPRMRGLVIAGYQVFANLVGYGVGPFLVGILSDAIGGPKSLGSALTLVLMINLWSTLHFVLAVRSTRRDLNLGVGAALPQPA